jgi:hypothetical protein
MDQKTRGRRTSALENYYQTTAKEDCGNFVCAAVTVVSGALTQ